MRDLVAALTLLAVGLALDGCAALGAASYCGHTYGWGFAISCAL
jgi:hypothetical protein